MASSFSSFGRIYQGKNKLVVFISFFEKQRKLNFAQRNECSSYYRFEKGRPFSKEIPRISSGVKCTIWNVRKAKLVPSRDIWQDLCIQFAPFLYFLIFPNGSLSAKDCGSDFKHASAFPVLSGRIQSSSILSFASFPPGRERKEKQCKVSLHHQISIREKPMHFIAPQDLISKVVVSG